MVPSGDTGQFRASAMAHIALSIGWASGPGSGISGRTNRPWTSICGCINPSSLDDQDERNAMTRKAQTGASQRRKRITWSKALFAVAPAALLIAAPAPVHADGACTGLGSDYEAYTACTTKMNVNCVGRPRGFIAGVNMTCTYSDGGRDECLVQFAFLGGGRVDYSSCTYVPPDSEPAPALGAEPR